jgi:8-oxo-dGTP pyrophosphatase MutT (NUDIX family)
MREDGAGGPGPTVVSEPKDIMPTAPPWFYRQSAAIPVRNRAGSVDVLLVTSRSGKRWVIPKGVVEPHLSPAESAAKEAWEEAGVRGSLRPESVGTYKYQKWGGTCTVEVFVLGVERLEDTWPEQASRQRRWVDVEEAAELVREDGLAAILRALSRTSS